MKITSTIREHFQTKKILEKFKEKWENTDWKLCTRFCCFVERNRRNTSKWKIQVDCDRFVDKFAVCTRRYRRRNVRRFPDCNLFDRGKLAHWEFFDKFVYSRPRPCRQSLWENEKKSGRRIQSETRRRAGSFFYRICSRSNRVFCAG